MTTTTTTETERRAWVGCLSCYNGGRLRGRWLTGEECAGPLRDTAPDLADGGRYELGGGEFDRCTRCGGDEWWCLDVEGLPSALVAEMSPGRFAELVELLEGLEADGVEVGAFVAWCSHIGEDPDKVDPDQFREAFQGTADSGPDFAAQWAEDLGAMPASDAPWPLQFIDWDAAWNELATSGWWMESDGAGSYWVFSS